VPKRISDTLNDHASRGILPAALTESLIDGLRSAIQQRDACQLLEMEDLIWPGKIASGLVENFVIPIQPNWAADLFDIRLRNRPLLDAEPDLLLNPECANHKAARGGPSADFGRILWYVSQNERYSSGFLEPARTWADTSEWEQKYSLVSLPRPLMPTPLETPEKRFGRPSLQPDPDRLRTFEARWRRSGLARAGRLC